MTAFPVRALKLTGLQVVLVCVLAGHCASAFAGQTISATAAAASAGGTPIVKCQNGTEQPPQECKASGGGGGERAPSGACEPCAKVCRNTPPGTGGSGVGVPTGGGCAASADTDSYGCSFIDNGSFNYHHYAYDYLVRDADGLSACRSCSSMSLPSIDGPRNLVLERRHRYRDMTWVSSFGPGCYSNYDIKLFIYPSDTGLAIDLFDPSRVKTFTLYDGTQGDAADGIFHDPEGNAVDEIRLLDAGNALTTDLNAAVVAALANIGGRAVSI